jgi:hypothetical protein
MMWLLIIFWTDEAGGRSFPGELDRPGELDLT